ncbi:MAG: hypothetical protein ACI4KA_04360 [Oscillospiraceae bacterium]
MRRVLYILCQCTWGIVQSLVGGVVLLINIRRPHRFYHGAIVTEWRHGGSVSLGMFVFLSENKSAATKQRLLMHEYGHTLQSLMLGPLYLLVIGLPSILWAGLPAFERLRQAKQISYYRFYTEKWADMLSAWAIK